MKLSKHPRALALGLGLAFVPGCTSPQSLCGRGVTAVSRGEVNDQNVALVQGDLDASITLARRTLQDDDERVPAIRDQHAYMIPIARLAKAQVHVQYDQLAEAEEQCWQAVRQSEIFLGEHVRNFQDVVDSSVVPFGAYSTFFRREKIRRHAFTILMEGYRRAGEKDLVALMKAQIENSSIYLGCPVAHHEEEYVRTLENGHWFMEYEITKAETRSNMLTTAIVLLTIAAMGAGANASMQMQHQAAVTTDPNLAANLNMQAQQLNLQMTQLAQQAGQTLDSIEQSKQATVSGLVQGYKTTLAGALSATFQLVSLSPEVRSLPVYRKLHEQSKQFDDYVQKKGFDVDAAKQLAVMRASLDELTAELQKKRKAKAGK